MRPSVLFAGSVRKENVGIVCYWITHWCWSKQSHTWFFTKSRLVSVVLLLRCLWLSDLLQKNRQKESVDCAEISPPSLSPFSPSLTSWRWTSTVGETRMTAKAKTKDSMKVWSRWVKICLVWGRERERERERKRGKRNKEEEREWERERERGEERKISASFSFCLLSLQMMSKMDVGGPNSKFDPGVSESMLQHSLPCDHQSR